MSRSSSESIGNEPGRMTEKKHRQPETEDEGTFKGPTFYPPVYRQRYAAVGALVQKYKAKKVIDFGCAEAKLVRYLISEDSLTHMEILIGVDIDQDLLERSEFRIQPLTSDYLRPRSHPFKVGLYQGSIAEADERFIDFDLIACVEIIEHLEGDVLDAMPKALFGQLKPKVVLVTTPNVEFNVLFPDLKGFRHYDHKFEWTREEFQQWAVTQGGKFGYTVMFDGIGPGPEGTQHLGCCSQLAVFERISSVADRMDASDLDQPYNLIAEVEHPFREDNTSKEEKILREVEYVLWVLSGSEMECDESNEQENGDDPDHDGNDDDDDDDDNDDGNDNNDHNNADDDHRRRLNSTNCTYSMNKADGPKLYPFERLLSFVSLHKLCDSVEDLRYVLETSSAFSISDDGSGVLWQKPSEWSTDDSENDWDRIDSDQDLHTTVSNTTETSIIIPECWDENFSEADKYINFTRKETDICWDSSDDSSKFWNGKIWNESDDNETQDRDIEEPCTMSPCCSLHPGLEESDSSFDGDDNSDLVWIVAENELTVNYNSSV